MSVLKSPLSHTTTYAGLRPLSQSLKHNDALKANQHHQLAIGRQEVTCVPRNKRRVEVDVTKGPTDDSFIHIGHTFTWIRAKKKSPAGEITTRVCWVDPGFNNTHPSVGNGTKSIQEGWDEYFILFQQTGFSDMKRFSIGIGIGICVWINISAFLITEGIN